MGKVKTFSAKISLVIALVVILLSVSVTALFLYFMYDRRTKEYQHLSQVFASNIDYVFTRNMTEIRGIAEEWYVSYDGLSARLDEDYSIVSSTSFMRDIRKQMERLPFIQSVCIVNKEKETSFQIESSVSFVENLSSEMEECVKELQRGMPPFVWNAPDRFEKGKEVYLLSVYAQEAPMELSYYAGTLVINLDTSELSKWIFSDILQEQFSAYILNEDGVVVAHSDISQCGEYRGNEEYVKQILQDENGNSRVTIEGQSFELTYMNSKKDGFYIVVQSEYMGESLGVLTVLPVLAILSVCLSFILLVYALCKIMFRPFNEIATRFRKVLGEEYGVEEAIDEIQLLLQYHQYTTNYIRELRLREDKNLIVKGLLQENWSRDLQHFLLEKNIVAADGGYYVAILYLNLDDFNEQITIDILNQKRIKVGEFCCKNIQIMMKCSFLELGVRRIMLVLAENGNEKIHHSTLCAEVEQLQAKIKRELKMNVTIALSDRGTSWEFSCMELYRQAKTRMDLINLVTSNSQEDDNEDHDKSDNNNREEFIERVIDYLNENYGDNNINVNVVADHFGISRSYFGKLFQEYIGKSMLNYLLDVRMDRARVLLITEPDKPIIQIAEEVGFGSSAYFANCFKKYYGVSPSKLRELGNVETQE